jgi:hypothetical protein
MSGKPLSWQPSLPAVQIVGPSSYLFEDKEKMLVPMTFDVWRQRSLLTGRSTVGGDLQNEPFGAQVF